VKTKIISNASKYVVSPNIPIIGLTADDKKNKSAFISANNNHPAFLFVQKPLAINEPFISFTTQHINWNQHPRILALDDEPFNIKVVVFIIQAKFPNAKFIVATNPVKGISLMRKKESQIDLIITDFNMPKMNGGEFVSLIRKGIMPN
jgi:PleD family two-component response regulator